MTSTWVVGVGRNETLEQLDFVEGGLSVMGSALDHF